MLTKYTPGQQAVLRRAYDDYWGPQAKTDEPHHPLLREVVDDEARASSAARSTWRSRRSRRRSSRRCRSRRASGSTRARAAVIRYLVMNVTRAPTNNLAVRRARRLPDAAAGDRHAGLPRPRASRSTRWCRPVYPGHIDAFATLVRTEPEPGEGEGRSRSRPGSRRRSRSRSGGRRPTTVTRRPTSTRRSSAALETERRLQGDAEVDASGRSTASALGTQYNVFQLGWFPDYPDAENYVVPFYRSDTFTANGYKNPKMEALHQDRSWREDAGRARSQCHQADPAAGGQGRADHPVLAGRRCSPSVGTTCAGSRARSTRRSSCGSGSCRSRSSSEGASARGAPRRPFAGSGCGYLRRLPTRPRHRTRR